MELKNTKEILLKNRIYLIIIPIISAVLTFIFISIRSDKFNSSVSIYTGQSSANDASYDIINFNFSQTNNDLDNVISFINSGPKKQEILLRTFAKHLYKYQNKKQDIPPNHLDYIQSVFLDIDETHYYDSVSSDATYKKLSDLIIVNDTLLKDLIFNIDSPYNIDQLTELKILKTSTTDIIKVFFSSKSDVFCKDILNEVTLIIKNSFELIKSSGAKKIEKFFKEKLKETELNLKKTELNLLSFRKENGIVDFLEEAKILVNAKQEAITTVSISKNKMMASLANLDEIKVKLKQNNRLFSENIELLKKEEALSDLVKKISKDNTLNNENTTLHYQNKIDQIKNEIKVHLLNIINPDNDEITSVPNKILIEKWIESFIDFNTQEVIYNSSKAFLAELNLRIENTTSLEMNYKRLNRQIIINETSYFEILKAYEKSILRQQNQKLSNNFIVIESADFTTEKITPNKIFTTIFGFMFGLFGIISVLITISYLKSTLNQLK